MSATPGKCRGKSPSAAAGARSGGRAAGRARGGGDGARCAQERCQALRRQQRHEPAAAGLCRAAAAGGRRGGGKGRGQGWRGQGVFLRASQALRCSQHLQEQLGCPRLQEQDRLLAQRAANTLPRLSRCGTSAPGPGLSVRLAQRWYALQTLPPAPAQGEREAARPLDNPFAGLPSLHSALCPEQEILTGGTGR